MSTKKKILPVGREIDSPLVNLVNNHYISQHVFDEYFKLYDQSDENSFDFTDVPTDISQYAWLQSYESLINDGRSRRYGLRDIDIANISCIELMTSTNQCIQIDSQNIAQLTFGMKGYSYGMVKDEFLATHFSLIFKSDDLHTFYKTPANKSEDMQSFLKNNSVSKINVYPIEGDPTKYDIEWSPLSTNDMNDAQQMVVLDGRNYLLSYFSGIISVYDVLAAIYSGAHTEELDFEFENQIWNMGNWSELHSQTELILLLHSIENTMVEEIDLQHMIKVKAKDDGENSVNVYNVLTNKRRKIKFFSLEELVAMPIYIEPEIFWSGVATLFLEMLENVDYLR